MNEDTDGTELNQETLRRIREQVLTAEKKQLHMKRPHNIIPEIQEIIEEEVTE
jgi:hypothetical protein